MKHKAFVISTTCLLVVLLSGGGCQLFQKKEPVVIQPPEITVSPTNPAKKIFKDTVGQFSFEYPGSWINKVEDTEGLVIVNFYKNEKDKKDDVPVMIFKTPMYDTGFETMQVVETKRNSFNNSKGEIEYLLVRPCMDEQEALADGPCKPKKQGGLAVAMWQKDVTKKFPEGDYKILKYQTGEFYIDLSPMTSTAKEEKKMLTTFDEILKSFKFTDSSKMTTGKSLQEYLTMSNAMENSGNTLSSNKIPSLDFLVEAFVIDTSISCGDNWRDEFCDSKTRKYLSESVVLTDKDWKDGMNHAFYFKSNKAESQEVYLGPFNDNVLKLWEEAKKSKLLLPSIR